MLESERLERLRYRGDAEDVAALFGEYNVGGFLATRAAAEKKRLESFRNHLLKVGVLLNETLSPRILGIINDVIERLGLEGDFDVICVRDNDVNAFAAVDNSEGAISQFIGITSAALENLEDAEIASLVGHEIGHFLYEHNDLQGLVNRDEDNPRITVLPYLGECLFLRWQKKGEISADRIGLLASGSFEASARALVKAGFGLSEKNLNLNIDSLLEQIESIKDKPEAVEAAFRSHPLLPLRLKALHLFSEAAEDPAADLAEVDAAIEQLFAWFKRYPRKPVDEAVMRIVAIAGMRIIGADENLGVEETKTLIYLLHSNFTDEPEKELVLDPAERERLWKEAVDLVKREGDQRHVGFITYHLANVAIADGKLMKEEAGYILSVAEELGMKSDEAYGIIVDAAQSTGFSVDSRLQGIVRQVRRQYAESVLRQQGT